MYRLLVEGLPSFTGAAFRNSKKANSVLLPLYHHRSLHTVRIQWSTHVGKHRHSHPAESSNIAATSYLAFRSHYPLRQIRSRRPHKPIHRYRLKTKRQCHPMHHQFHHALSKGAATSGCSRKPAPNQVHPRTPVIPQCPHQ